jgi:hypothetical protein
MNQTKQENKVLVLEVFDTLFNKRDYEAAERYWSPNYIQHSAHIEPGRDGLFNLIRNTGHATLRTSAHRRGGRLRHRARTILRNRAASLAIVVTRATARPASTSINKELSLSHSIADRGGSGSIGI